MKKKIAAFKIFNKRNENFYGKANERCNKMHCMIWTGQKKKMRKRNSSSSDSIKISSENYKKIKGKKK